jgi:ketosteroid isomerase-like protein
VQEELLKRLYAAFNERDIEAVLAHLDEGVDWPNAWEGGRLHGRDAVRDYWTRQWAEIDGYVEPAGFTARPGSAVAVDVRQTVRALDGALLSEGSVVHVYRFRDGLVTRMDVEETAG